MLKATIFKTALSICLFTNLRLYVCVCVYIVSYFTFFTYIVSIFPRHYVLMFFKGYIILQSMDKSHFITTFQDILG